MKRMVGVLLLAGAALAVGADDKKDDAVKEEMKKLEGTWLTISTETDGKKSTDANVVKVVVKGDKFTYYLGDMLLSRLTVSVDPTKKPKTMDCVLAYGPNEGAKMLAIYELDGDKLKISITEEKERPKEFVTKKGDKITVTEYKREKK